LMANVQHSPLEFHALRPPGHVQMAKRLNLATRARTKIQDAPPA
jgi:hypothetical protein